MPHFAASFSFLPATQAAAVLMRPSVCAWPASLDEYASWLLARVVLLEGREMVPVSYRRLDGGGVALQARFLDSGTLSPKEYPIRTAEDMPCVRLSDWQLA